MKQVQETPARDSLGLLHRAFLALPQDEGGSSVAQTREVLGNKVPLLIHLNPRDTQAIYIIPSQQLNFVHRGKFPAAARIISSMEW